MTTDYDRIETAIRYLQANFQRQPSLDELAEHLHLSPFHLQRVFKEWAGITPKRFVQYLTVEYTRQLLAEAHSVLDAAYAAGLSGPSRLHDLYVAVEAMTPGQVKAQGAGLAIYYGFHDTPFGECLLAATERGVCAFWFLAEGERAEAVIALQERWHQAALGEDSTRTRSLLDAIFPPHASPDPRQLTLLLKGTNFQLKVWEALLNIPSGYAASYEDVATAIGQPAATRAVASAIAANQIAYLIPCHRVLRKSGLAGEYRWGAERKRAMLAWEASKRQTTAYRDPRPSSLTT